MKAALKIVGAILIALSLIPGAISLWQAYGAYTFSTSSLNSGRYGSFGRELAEDAAEVRTTRAVIFGGVSFVFGVGGVIALVIGLKKPKGGAAGQPQQGYPQQQPQQGYAPPGGYTPQGGGNPRGPGAPPA